MPGNLDGAGISLILPVFNEERIIEECINRLLLYFKGKASDFELIFVDDGSSDRTTSIIKEYILNESRIKLINLSTRVGKGGSIISAALQSKLKEYVAYLDSDLAADPSELERLFGYIKDFDVVLGSRILRGNLPPIKRPLYRSFFSHIYSRMFRILFRIPIYDPQCGFKLFRKEVALKLFSDITTLGFAFDTDLIVRAYAQGFRVKEVPITWTHGKHSKVSVFNEIQSMGLDLLSIWYSSHLLWLENKVVYPQKRGTIYGRIFFAMLSFSGRIKERPSTYPKLETNMSTLNQN